MNILKTKTNNKRLIMISAAILIIVFGTLVSGVLADSEEVICDDCCDAEYTDYYRCSDDSTNRERLWQNDDCGREWKAVKDCSYGCSEGECLDCDTALTEMSVFSPSDVFEDDEFEATMKIENKADYGRRYYIKPYLCRSSGDCDSGDSDSCSTMDCKLMECDSTDVYVRDDSTRYVKCSKTVNNIGKHVVKIDYSTDPTRDSSVSSASGDCKTDIYSDTFNVLSESQQGTEADEDGKLYVNEYRCFGNYKQRKYMKDVEGETEWRWSIVEYCQYGCENEDNHCAQPSQAEIYGEEPQAGQQEIEDDIEETRSTGLFNVAPDYWLLIGSVFVVVFGLSLIYKEGLFKKNFLWKLKPGLKGNRKTEEKF